MQTQKSIDQVCENAHPARKDDKWFRLSKMSEEYSEFKSETNIKSKLLELQDLLLTLALMTPFVTDREPIGGVEYTAAIHEWDFVQMATKAVNKQEYKTFDCIYYYLWSELIYTNAYGFDLSKSMADGYDRLVCGSVV